MPLLSLVKLLQTMQKIVVVCRLANDRIQLINSVVVRGMIKCHSSLACILVENNFIPMNRVDLRVEPGD
jgi:hypothetical protein